MDKAQLNFTRPKHQSGMASIIFIVLVSLAVTTTSIGVIHSFNGSREISIASNAVTHAQNGAWLGAETFRRHLVTLNADDVADLDGINQTIEFSDTSIGTVEVYNVGATLQTNGSTLLTADIKNVHPTARTSSALRLVYEYTPPPPPVNPPPFLDINPSFGGDLVVNGGIKLGENSPMPIKTDGDVNIGGTGLENVTEISAIGNVSVGSGVDVETIHANGHIHLIGGAKADIVQAYTTFTIEGGGYAKNIFANGDVEYLSSGASEVIQTRGNIKLDGGGIIGDALAGGDIEISKQSSNLLEAIGNIKINYGSHKVAKSKSNIKCPNEWWANTTLISAKTLETCHKTHASFKRDQSNNSIELPGEVPPYEYKPTLIDVWTRIAEAHYFVEYDIAASAIKVTINNINGIADGTALYVGDYRNPINGKQHNDYLCTKVNGGYCDAPAVPLLPLCFGESLSNDCISHQIVDGESLFVLDPAYTAPGVLFFNGSVKLKDGYPMNTILAAGNIETAGSFKMWAPNRGGYSKICEADASHHSGNNVRATRYTQTFSEYYPRDLCDISTSTYNPSHLGNVGLAAGGYAPTAPATYKGGFISLGASTDIVGAVLAGDVIRTNGDVDINGILMSAGNGSSTDGNQLDGSTDIDLIPEGHYNFEEVPDLSFIPTPPADTEATVIWVRNI